MSESILRDKAKEFAKEIVVFMREIKEKHKENILTNQLLRSGTGIGANIHEAQYAQSTADFISKLEIALKECFESEYWLELLFETNYLIEDDYKKLKNECGTIRKMLISSCKTAKSKNE
ncbi:MAG: four helix bundle protein [Clostridiales bacterium]|nr:four helix bundle protein [Clostridiales bacterium]